MMTSHLEASKMPNTFGSNAFFAPSGDAQWRSFLRVLIYSSQELWPGNALSQRLVSSYVTSQLESGA